VSPINTIVARQREDAAPATSWSVLDYRCLGGRGVSKYTNVDPLLSSDKRPAPAEPWFGDGKAACTGPVGMAATRDKVALHDKSSQSYEASLAVWDHTVLPPARHN